MIICWYCKRWKKGRGLRIRFHEAADGEGVGCDPGVGSVQTLACSARDFSLRIQIEKLENGLCDFLACPDDDRIFSCVYYTTY